jgi:ATP-dependent RNA helicase DeaD
MNLFSKLGISQQLLRSINRLGFEKPTQIQELSLPLITQGKDVIGESATGSGKTLAFAAGIVEKVEKGHGVQALVLTPTRELAQQVKNEIQKISGDNSLKVTTIYGGVAIGPQIDELRRVEVVVGTPGRILDHIRRRTIILSKVRLLVLDEVDRMLDMGFLDDVENIIRECPKERQTLFFSATIPTSIKKLTERHMNNPTKVVAKVFVDPTKLKQCYIDTQRGQKFPLLVNLLKKEESELVMVFCNTRMNVDFVSKNLKLNKINATPIHGGLTQNKREHTLSKFNDGKTNVLVCTDVAARGLHISNVSHIYNYDIPKDTRDYVHRIGRTARAGESGQVINLLSYADYDNFGKVQDNYRDFNIEKVPTPACDRVEMDTSPTRGSRRDAGRGSRFSRGRPSFSRGGSRSNFSRGSPSASRGRSGSRDRSNFSRNSGPKEKPSFSRSSSEARRKPTRSTQRETRDFKESSKSKSFKGAQRR